MTDDTTKQRPIDPTTNASDIFGDTRGMSGATMSTPATSGAEPEDVIQDDSTFRGGVLPQAENNSGIKRDQTGQKEYEKAVFQGMSQAAADRGEDIAREDEITPPPQEDTAINPSSPKSSFGDLRSTDTGPTNSVASPHEDTGDHDPLTQDADNRQPYNVGESDAVGGTTPDPSSDDEALAMAQRAGTQLNETGENPQELDIARDVDEAEQAIRDK